MKRLLIILFTFLIFFVNDAKAIQEYTTTYTSTYTILPNNKTRVLHNIEIKNNLANIYATSYTISVGSNKLENIITQDEHGRINPKITISENSTTIEIPIENPTVGKDKIKKIMITYTNPDIVEHNVNIWEINIPRLSNANEINNYSRKLVVPSDFPSISLSTPEPEKTEENGEKIYLWQGHKTDSITMFFGEAQFYKLNLKYIINNPTLQNADTEIAIPPDTEYQKIYLQQINPEPKEILRDIDGNWLATYHLANQEEKEINVSLVAKVVAKPTFKIPYSNLNLDQLTSESNYWNTKANPISELATQLKNPKNIYNYIIDNLTYNYSRVKTNAKRLGANNALENPNQAICTEFTDTFVAIARSANIPAREINGYAHTNNTDLRPLSLEMDVLHAWPEYYDKNTKTWVQIDPTWANTTGGIDYFSKLDYNHITFVRHGIEDSYPYPAGAYKKDANTKAIKVEIIEKEPEEIFDIKIEQSNKQVAILGTKDILTIYNNGNTAIINQTIEVPENGKVEINYLPPYGKKEITKNSNLNLLNSENLPFISIVTISTGLLLLIGLLIYIKKNN